MTESTGRQTNAPPRREPEADEVAVYGLLRAAKYIGSGRDQLRDMLRTGELLGWRTHGSERKLGAWRVSKAELDRWIERQEEGAREHRRRLFALPRALP